MRMSALSARMSRTFTAGQLNSNIFATEDFQSLFSLYPQMRELFAFLPEVTV